MASTHSPDGRFRRVSSTSLGTFLDCPYKWWRGLQTPLPESAAMATGTLYHAIQEEHVRLGRLPLKSRVQRAKGNYADPGDVMKRFPAAWDIALAMASEVDPFEAASLEGLELGKDFDLERALDDFGFYFDGDILAGGFFDLIVYERQEVLDWKTRSRFSYAPQTFAEFTANLQFLYYAAAAHHAWGWDPVRVTHLNVQRPSGRFRRDGTELPGFLLREIWDVIDVEIVPHMRRVEAELQEAARNQPEACWKYGPCRFLGECDGTDVTDMFAGLEDLL